MTRRSLAIDETRRLLFRQQQGRCQCCGKMFGVYDEYQLAHRIPQRKWCIKRWGADVIHHPLNMALVCCLACNATVQINPDSLEAGKLAEKIKKVIASEHRP